MRLIWPSQLSLAKMLFFLNRYVILVTAFVLNYRECSGRCVGHCSVSFFKS